MRKVIGAFLAIALVAGVAVVAHGPGPAGAQGGGTIEAAVMYAGAPVVEKLKVNKDTEKCGTEAVIEKVVVGANKGLAYAVVSVPGAKGGAKAVKTTVDQHGCKFVPHVTVMTPGELDLKELGRHPAQHPHLFDGESVHQQGSAQVQEGDDGEVREARDDQAHCDVHSWMLGWVAVIASPFFGVTDANGVTKIENVPTRQVHRRGVATRRSASRRRTSRSRPGRPRKSPSR